MRSIILQTTTRLASAVIIMFSLFLFLRGHNDPGGGFIGGLMGAAGILLIYISFGLRQADWVFPFNYRLMASIGLLCAGLAGIMPMFVGLPFLTSGFHQVNLPLIGPFDFSTVLLFDFGVYLVVIGTMVGSVRVLVLERFQSALPAEESNPNREDDAAWRQ